MCRILTVQVRMNMPIVLFDFKDEKVENYPIYSQIFVQINTRQTTVYFLFLFFFNKDQSFPSPALFSQRTDCYYKKVCSFGIAKITAHVFRGSSAPNILCCNSSTATYHKVVKI